MVPPLTLPPARRTLGADGRPADLVAYTEDDLRLIAEERALEEMMMRKRALEFPQPGTIRGPAWALLTEDNSQQPSYRDEFGAAVDAVRGFGGAVLGGLDSPRRIALGSRSPGPTEPQTEPLPEPSWYGVPGRVPPEPQPADLNFDRNVPLDLEEIVKITGAGVPLPEWAVGSLSSQQPPMNEWTYPFPDGANWTPPSKRNAGPSQNLGPFDPLLGDPIIGGDKPLLGPMQAPRPQLKPQNPSNALGLHPPWVKPEMMTHPPRDMRAPQHFPFEPGGRAGTTGATMPSNFAREESEAKALAQPGGRPVFGTAPSGRQVFSANRLPETNTARGYRNQLAAGDQARELDLQRRRRSQLSAAAPSGPQGPRKEDYLDIAQMFDGAL